MSGKRYTDEFKIEVVKQVTERGHSVADVAERLGYRSTACTNRRPGQHYGRPAVIAPNHVQHQFSVAEPNQVRVTDITYIRTYECWLYLAVVLDLFLRQVIGWSMQSRIDRELATRQA